MPYPATDIAYEFVKMGIEQNKPVTQMKLQKLVYFAHGLHLALHGVPIINETFQAWKFGPVVPTIYFRYKFYRDRPISDTEWLFWLSNKELDSMIIDPESKKCIEDTWTSLKNANAIQLSNWTHKDGSPWQKYYVEGVQDIDIPNEEIEKYFKDNFIAKSDVSK